MRDGRAGHCGAPHTERGRTAWLATAYVPWPSLTDAIDDHGPLPAGSLLTLAAGPAESLSAIHAAGVVQGTYAPDSTG